MCGPHGDDIAPLPSSAFGGCGCGPTGGRNNSCVYRVGSSCWLFLSLSLSLFPFPPTFFLFLPSVSDPFDCSCRRIQISEELGAGGGSPGCGRGALQSLGSLEKTQIRKHCRFISTIFEGERDYTCCVRTWGSKGGRSAIALMMELYTWLMRRM